MRMRINPKVTDEKSFRHVATIHGATANTTQDTKLKRGGTIGYKKSKIKPSFGHIGQKENQYNPTLKS